MLIMLAPPPLRAWSAHMQQAAHAHLKVRTARHRNAITVCNAVTMLRSIFHYAVVLVFLVVLTLLSQDILVNPPSDSVRIPS